MLNFGFFTDLQAEKEPDVLASVTVDDVRDVVNISSADVPDAKILKMLKRAEVTLELELGKIRMPKCSIVCRNAILGNLSPAQFFPTS